MQVSVQRALKRPAGKNGLSKLCLLQERQTPQHLLQMWLRKIQTGINLPEDGARGHGPGRFSKTAELGLIKKLPLPPTSRIGDFSCLSSEFQNCYTPATMCYTFCLFLMGVFIWAY